MTRDRKERPPEQEAVNTTIVGGRPPGCGKPVGPIPRGLEVLVKKAAVDPAFKDLLLTQRARAAASIQLTLDPAEAMMLNAVPAAQLAGIIANTVVPPKQRPAFLGKVAAVMLIAIGASVLTGCEATSRGERPDRPPVPPEEQVQPPAPTGIRPDVPDTKPEATPEVPVEQPTPPPGPTKGLRPDPPPPNAGVQPERPQRLEPTDGIRPETEE